MKVVFDMQKIGNQIQHYRSINNISIIELSKKIDISKDILNKYESGKRVPSIYDLIKICNFYSIKPEDIIIYEIK